MNRPAAPKPNDPGKGLPASSGDEGPKVSRSLRWLSFFQDCRDPLVLLNRQRRILLVNPAWETLTGRFVAEVRGWVCKRRSGDNEPGSAQALQVALAPPPEVLEGNPARTRRLVLERQAGPQWWDIHFFPLPGPEGLLGILARITVVPPASFPQRRPLPEAIMALRQRRAQPFAPESLSSEQPFLQRVREQVRLASRTAVGVVLVGEAGTGKAWLARTIHQHSARREEFFAVLDCGRLPVQALVDVLFGQAWPRRLAVGGIYLREPSHLPREVQEELCQRLSADPDEGLGGGPPRILAGFRTDPLAEVSAGRLLPGLFGRLSTLTITLPPLRERLSDWRDLVQRFLARASAAADKPVPALSPETEEILRSYHWPENLQEFLGILRQGCGRCRGQRIEAADLPYHLRAAPLPAEGTLPLDSLLEQVERRLLILALRLARNNKAKAAQLLGIWRTRLQRRLEALGISAP